MNPLTCFLYRKYDSERCWNRFTSYFFFLHIRMISVYSTIYTSNAMNNDHRAINNDVDKQQKNVMEWLIKVFFIITSRMCEKSFGLLLSKPFDVWSEYFLSLHNNKNDLIIYHLSVSWKKTFFFNDAFHLHSSCNVCIMNDSYYKTTWNWNKSHFNNLLNHCLAIPDNWSSRFLTNENETK